MVKAKRRKVLCRVEDLHEELIIYTDGKCRYASYNAKDEESYFKWRLEHSDNGPMFYYQGHDVIDKFDTDWAEDNEVEIILAEKVAKALADLEMDKLLKGKI